MLTVDDYGRIRRAHRDGMSVRGIARTFGHSRRKIREVLVHPEPRPYTRSKDPPAPKLGPFHKVIEAVLAADEEAPPKQRHTAAQVFRRLRDEHGYAGGYDAVRRYVGKRRRRQRQTFIPLSHDPGQRLECDFGHIYVDLPDGRRQVAVLLAAWSYSHCPFAMALPTERTEAILAGMVAAVQPDPSPAAPAWPIAVAGRGRDSPRSRAGGLPLFEALESPGGFRVCYLVSVGKESEFIRRAGQRCFFRFGG